MSSTNVFLAISVFLNLLLLALFWASYSGSGETATELTQIKNKSEETTKALAEKVEDIRELKNKLGLSATLVGRADEADGQEAGTVLFEMNQLISKGGDNTKGAKTIKGAIDQLASVLESQSQQLNKKSDVLLDEQKRYNTNDQQLRAQVKQHQLDAAAANKAKTDLIKTQGEALAAKDTEIDQTKETLRTVRQKFEQDIAELETIRTAQADRIVKQSTTIRIQNRKLLQQQDDSFEIADGQIVYVDNNRGIVTINLGRADGLRRGTTFSVYQKDNSGIGRRNVEDIKGKIQVTNIRGPHEAEGRLLASDSAVRRRNDELTDDYYARSARYSQERLLRPISIGDPIYSPAFTKGEVLQFSLVGLIDLDGDGKSDRTALRNQIQAAGAKIDNEVDDDGKMLGTGEITYRTKFLIIGDLGENADTGDTKLLARYQAMQKQANGLRQDALDAGVRIVTLGAFLNYLGYQPTSSPWVKGEGYKTRLTAGAASDSTAGGLGQRTSSGNVSALHSRKQRNLYNLNDRIGRRGTTGDVSGVYKGK